MLNDPFRGGTHLPDITVVAPVFVRTRHARRAIARANSAMSATAPEFFVAARAHHADVGGTYAGSMGPCREIYQEGLRIPPVKIVRAGKIDRDVLALLLNNVRTPEEREGDLSAQLAACHTGSTRLLELCARYGLPRVQRAARRAARLLRENDARLSRDGSRGKLRRRGFSRRRWRERRAGAHRRAHHLSARHKTARRKPRPVVIDFTGSSPQVEGSINAVEAITYSACFYVFRCLLREDVPATAGLMRPIQLIAPAGTVVNARPPAAVAGGNVETSQRIVDVLLRALAQALPERIPAASSGTMNNLTIGGMDDRSGEAGSLRLLRNHRRRLGRQRGPRRRLRRAHAHDQLAQHAGRGAGVQLSVPRDEVCPARGQRRRRQTSRRRRHRARDGSAGRRHGDPALRPPQVPALRTGGRRRRRAGTHRESCAPTVPANSCPARAARACAAANASASKLPAAADGAKRNRTEESPSLSVVIASALACHHEAKPRDLLLLTTDNWLLTTVLHKKGD